MNTINKRVESAISVLSPKNKQIFDFIIEKTKEEELANIYELIEEDPHFLQIIIDNYKEKVEAFQSKDKSKFQRIIDKEVKILEEIDEKD